MYRTGDHVGPYTLVRLLGRGGFGVVWLAEKHTPIATTTVAIKMPLDQDADLNAIRQEASLWIQASGHPNVVPLIEANIYDDQIVIVSEYAPDGSLQQWLKQKGSAAPDLQTAGDLVLGILSGLEHLHARHIIHRDLKPDNVLLQGQTPRLADFGISRVLKTTSQRSAIAGTPAYMAPEAFSGKRNEKTDIWSVGVILYQLLSGRLPFPQDDIPSLVGALLSADPPCMADSIPKPLHDVIARSLEKDPERRYQTAKEFKVALIDALALTRRDPKTEIASAPLVSGKLPGDDRAPFQEYENTVPTPEPAQSLPAPRKRSRPLTYTASALFVVLITAVIVLAWYGWKASTSARSAGEQNNSAPQSANALQSNLAAGVQPDAASNVNAAAPRETIFEKSFGRLRVKYKKSEEGIQVLELTNIQDAKELGCTDKTTNQFSVIRRDDLEGEFELFCNYASGNNKGKTATIHVDDVVTKLPPALLREPIKSFLYRGRQLQITSIACGSGGFINAVDIKAITP